MALAKDFRSLVLNFVNSDEYAAKMFSVAVVPIHNRAMEVECGGSRRDLRKILERIRETWTHLGLVNAHYSVLTGKEFLREFLSGESIERFYDSGTAEATWNDSILRRYGFSSTESKTCVEYGCGLGRVTLAMAKLFWKVHGYDISANHLALAQRRAADAGIHNVEFHQCPANRVAHKLERCDFFYSRLVFQHNPPPIIRKLILASLRSLRQGGIAIFQVPTYMHGYSFRIKEYLASPRTLDMEMHCIPLLEVYSLVADEKCEVLEVKVDDSIGNPGIWISNTFVVQRVAKVS